MNEYINPVDVSEDDYHQAAAYYDALEQEERQSLEPEPATFEEAAANLTKAMDELKNTILDEVDLVFHLEATLRKLSKTLNKLLKEGK